MVQVVGTMPSTGYPPKNSSSFNYPGLLATLAGLGLALMLLLTGLWVYRHRISHG